MSYQVLARAWRPQTFSDVVGQEAVTRTLQNAIRSDRLAHAFLFSGIRGVGKTTTARILAKALNCHQGPAEEPCNDCVSCNEIAAATSVDVLEIDAASNTGVDNIRELRESVRYGTARDRFKIFIIDEVHMLSNAAFNALLKTLEEPPSHVKFILATTEHHKIPMTIISRCQHYQFKPIPFQLILERLQQIAEAEELEISSHGLRLVAAAGQGSLRDAQSSLDQIISFSGRSISDDDIKALLGVVDDRLAGEVLDSVLEGDSRTLIQHLEQISDSGIPPQNFCRKLIDYVRNLMICRVAGWDERLLQLPDSEKDRLLRQSQQLSELDLIRFYDLLNRSQNELRWHARPEVHLEITLLKLVELAKLPTVEAVIQQLQEGSGFSQGFPKDSDSSKKEPTSKNSAREVRDKPGRVDRKTSAPEGQSDLESSLKQRLKSESMGLYQHLECASRIELSEENLSIDFPSSQEFHAVLLRQPENLQRLSRVCAKITGSKPEIKVAVEESEPGKETSSPTDDPRIKAFIENFPGKIILNKDFED